MGLYDQIVQSTRTQAEIEAEKQNAAILHTNACIKERLDYIIAQTVEKLREAAHAGQRSIVFSPHYTYHTADSISSSRFRPVDNVKSSRFPFAFLLRSELQREYQEDRWGSIPNQYQNFFVEQICAFLRSEGFSEFLVEFDRKQRGYVNGKLKVVYKDNFFPTLNIAVRW